MARTPQKFIWRCSGGVFGTVFAIVGALVPVSVFAHCPLCTLGAGAAAVTARFFGAGTATVGVFLGAFGLALGAWTNTLVKRQFVPFQRELLEGVSFFGTILPLWPLFREDAPIALFITGEYGSLLNRTYTLDIFLVSAVAGGMIMLFSKNISLWVSQLSGGTRVPYQGLMITFGALACAAFLLEILL